MPRYEVNIATGEIMELPDAPLPIKTNAEKIAEEVSILNTNLQINLKELSDQYVKALLANGTSEATKVAAIRSQRTALQTQFATDYAAIISKYQ